MGRKRRSGGKREIPLMRERGDLFLVLSYLRRYFCDWLVDQIYVNRVYSRNELVAPLVPGYGRPSKSYDKSPAAEPAPVFSGNRSGRRRTGNIGKPHAVSPPGQQAQEKYQSLLTHARDGKGKGLQRIF